ncbi:MAG: 50S ribosomal protein L6 [Chloroflexi bacterium]|nr:50S ribosomal protein L6 [Chloroflexota bacterium]
MSRIGRAPIAVPPNVQVEIGEQNYVKVRGPRGELARQLPPAMALERADASIAVRRPNDAREHRALHGLTRTLLANMVAGVTTGFTKVLELYGVGYRVQQQEGKLVFQLGYSHPIEKVLLSGIKVLGIETFTPTQANGWFSARLTLEGIDKEQLGQFAAEIRRLRRPDPYKGKGVRYRGEVVRRKAGKAGKAGKK